VFLQGDRISKELVLDQSMSTDVKLDFFGKGTGYYKITIPEFSREQLFIQILDKSHNVIAEQKIQTKMSVSYFKFENGGTFSIKVTNLSENKLNLIVELGDTNSEHMMLPGIAILIGTILIIVSSYLKLNNYKIAHPDENIS
jgi:hypothetical protein